jgi:hypothetical protein
MRIDFNIDVIREHQITLLDCQVDLILKSLELYSYTYRYVAPQRKSEQKEDELRISLVRDTYEQILNEYSISRKEQETLEKDKLNII